MKNLIFFLISISIITSCSIEKRLYKKGYNVQWHNSKVSKVTKEDSSEPSGENNNGSDVVQLNTPDEFEYHSTPLVELREELVEIKVQPSNKEVNIVHQKAKENTVESFGAQLPDLAGDEVNEPNNKTKKEGLALASLILGILAIPILSIVLGLVQLNRIKTAPNLYGGEKMARVGVALGVLYILLSTALLALIYGSLFIPIFATISVTLSVIGIIQLQRSYGKGSNFGILFTILGWLGLMFTTLLISI